MFATKLSTADNLKLISEQLHILTENLKKTKEDKAELEKNRKALEKEKAAQLEKRRMLIEGRKADTRAILKSALEHASMPEAGDSKEEVSRKEQMILKSDEIVTETMEKETGYAIGLPDIDPEVDKTIEASKKQEAEITALEATINAQIEKFLKAKASLMSVDVSSSSTSSRRPAR